MSLGSFLSGLFVFKKPDYAAAIASASPAAAAAALAPGAAQPGAAAAAAPSNETGLRCVSTANLNLAFAVTIIDGVTLLDGDSVLLMGQTDPTQNGVYQWRASSQLLGRHPSFPGAPQLAGKAFAVSAGLTGVGTVIFCTADPDTAIPGQAITFRALGLASGVTPTATADLIGQPGSALLASPADHRHPISPLHKGFAARLISLANVPLLTVVPALIDSVAPLAGDRILLAAQTNPAENGLYIVGANGYLTRAPEANTIGALAGQSVAIAAGLLNFGTKWMVQSAIDTDVVGGVTAQLGVTPVQIFQPVQAGDSGMAVPFAVRASLAAGAGGAASDDSLLLGTRWPNGFPFGVRLMNVDMYVTAAVASTVQIRSAIGGGGIAMTDAMSAAAAVHVRDAMAATPPLWPAGTQFYARRANNTIGADFMLTFARQL